MSRLFSRILVAVDGSEPATVAVAIGSRLAREHGGELTLCFCVNWKPLIAQFELIGAIIDPAPTIEAMKERGRRVLAEAAAAARQRGVDARTRACAGDPAVTLVDIARETASTLIVMGTHDGPGVQRLLVGNTTAAVLRRTPIPVLTVRPGIALAEESRPLFEHLIVATDGSDRSAGAVEVAVMLAAGDARKLTICSVAETTAGDAPKDSRAAVDRALAMAREGGVNAHGRVLAGSPAAALMDAAQRDHADAIVLGTHGRSGADRTALGCVAERIVRTAPLPVLVVRTTAGRKFEASAARGTEASPV